jgi:hypothetical protein
MVSTRSGKVLATAFVALGSLLAVVHAMSDRPGVERKSGTATQSAHIDFSELAKLPPDPKEKSAPKVAAPSLPAGPAPRPPVEKVAGTASQTGSVNVGDLLKKGERPDVAHPKAVPEPVRPQGDPVLAQSPWLAGPASPPPSANFPAVIDSCRVIPSNANGAVGPFHLVAVTNNEMVILDHFGSQSGQINGRVSLERFWEGRRALPQSRLLYFNPRIVFDRLAARWIFVTAVDPGGPDSALLVGVSNTADPTQDWDLKVIDADKVHDEWIDFPRIGHNRKWVVVQVNLFGRHVDTIASEIFVLDKKELYRGGPLNNRYTRLRLGDRDAMEYFLSLAPEINGDHSDSMHLVGTPFTNPSNRLMLYRLDGPASDPQLREELGMPIAVPSFWNATADQPRRNLAPQKGSDLGVSVPDARIVSVMSHRGTIWCVHAVFLPARGDSFRTAIQYWQIAPDSTGPFWRVLQFGRLDDPSGATSRAFPSLAVNDRGDVLIGYTRFGVDEYPSAAYALRLAGDPPNTFRKEHVYRPGAAPYNRRYGSDWRNRFADYSGTVVDPDGVEFWTVQTYAESPEPDGLTGRYGTQWARVSPPSLK